MNDSPDLRVTALLREAEGGDSEAMGRLLPLVYDELHDLAVQAFRRQAGHTLQPTALVHEAFLKLVQSPSALKDRKHFLIVAGMAMRQILCDHARGKGALKRAGRKATLMGVEDLAGQEQVDYAELDVALTRLEKLSERQARIVELRFFAGLAVSEVADVLGTSARTIGAEWRTARAFLQRELGTAG